VSDSSRDATKRYTTGGNGEPDTDPGVTLRQVFDRITRIEAQLLLVQGDVRSMQKTLLARLDAIRQKLEEDL
jgi:hypothetical protein